MIDNSLLNDDYFTKAFIQQCKRNANISQFIKKITKNIIKEIALEGGLYPQVVMIRCYILKTKVTKEDFVEQKENNNESFNNSRNKDDKEKECKLGYDC